MTCFPKYSTFFNLSKLDKASSILEVFKYSTFGQDTLMFYIIYIKEIFDWNKNE